MASIVSKNLYDLLGNDPEQDPDRAPDPPTKAVDKPVARTGKRNGASEAPSSSSRGTAQTSGSRGGRGNNLSGNDRAYRDGSAGTYQNRANPPSEGDFGGRGRGRGGRGGRGGTGSRGGRGRDDRHSKTNIGEHEKQAGHGWGYQTGKSELNDENAGEAIAKEEEKDGFDTNVPPPVNADGDAWAPDTAGGEDGAADAEPAEPEVVTKGYDEYQAELAEKKAQLGSELAIRQANEGAKKKFPEGKAFSRDEQEDFIAGGAGKKLRERAKKEKDKVDLSSIDPHKFLAPDAGSAPSGRGGRGRGRGDRGDRSDRGGDRGEYRGRGGRGGGESRGRGRGEGRGRGDFGRGGPRGGAGRAVNVDDQSAFPSLGA